MFGRLLPSSKLIDPTETVESLYRAMVVVEFLPDGRVLRASNAFCNLMGYNSSELSRIHHRELCSGAYTSTPAYAQFWKRLTTGGSFSGKVSRLTKEGAEVWLEATYVPVRDRDGRVTRIVKLASDITARVVHAQHYRNVLKALGKSMAVVEFTPDGRIVEANENFLSLMGYREADLVGKPHAILCPAGYRSSQEYRLFWDGLSRGAFRDGHFERVRRDGTPVWLEATYNPLIDANGEVYRVIKFATDITARINGICAAEERAAGIASDTAGLSREGHSAVSAAVEELQAVAEQARLSVELVHRLDAEIERVTASIEVIQKIAQQTNLLSLNAAIEAATAGKHGAGFSIVASEVRALAARTSEAAAAITSSIEEIRNESGRVADGIAHTLDKAERSAGIIEEAGSSIERITQGTEQVAEVVQKISTTLFKFVQR